MVFEAFEHNLFKKIIIEILRVYHGFKYAGFMQLYSIVYHQDHGDLLKLCRTYSTSVKYI